MPENREVLEVQKGFKFYVIQNGERVVRQFRPGEFLPRADWDREATGRSKRVMVATGMVRDPLNVEINQVTGRVDPIPPSKPSVTVYLPPTTVKRRGTDGHEYDKVIYGVDPNAGREPNQSPPKAGTRRNRKVWGDQPEPTAQRPIPVAGTRLNPNVWGVQATATPEVAPPAPKRRGRPPKQKA